MIHAPSSLKPSTRRIVPLHKRADLVVERIDFLNGAYFVIKDPVSLKYYRLGAEQYRVLELLDGTRSLEDVRDQLLLEFPYVRPTLGDLQMVVVDLHTKGLVYSGRPGQGKVLIERRREARKKKILSAAQNILSIRLPGWDPERTLAWLYPLVRWAFHPWAVISHIVLIGAAYLLLATQFGIFQQKLPEFQQFFGWPNLIYLYLTLGAMKVLHELGHGLTCHHFGGECHEIGIIVLVFSPTMYCDVSDSWMMKNKWHRIAIGAAGMWVEGVLSSVALFVWWFTTAGLMHHICLNVFFISSISTVIFNANPLMRYDGYYMLSDLLEIPNLSEKARTMLQNAFAHTCLGIETREDAFMPQQGREWLVLYAISSTIYRWVVLFGITLFLYTVLKPYDLQSIGVTLAWASLAGIVGSLTYGVVRIIRTPRNKPLSGRRIGASLLVVAAVAAAALAIPLPLHVYAPFLIEPHGVVHVYSSVPGTLSELLVEPGSRVERGQLLMRLADPDKERQYRELEAKHKGQLVEVDKQRLLNNPSGLAVAEQQRDSLERQLADYRQQLQLLEVRAPIAGTVVTPPRTKEPKDQGAAAFELHAWSGTPLERSNVGSLIEGRTQLCSVAPDDRFQAVLLVDQSDRGDISEKQEVQIKFDHLPSEVFEGTIADIGERHMEFAPASLTNKAGGELATVTDPQGRERLTSIAYEATVLLDGNSGPLCAGMRGRSRFLVGHRSAWQWVWRWYRHTFHFRL
jgi:putative peptide zinc metalloprotease protein